VEYFPPGPFYFAAASFFFVNWPPVVALFLSLMPASGGRYALRYRRALADGAVSFADLPTLDAIFD